MTLSWLEASNTAFFARQRLGFVPDAVQALVLDSRIRRGILNCTRQWGKSTVTAVKALHRGLAQEKSLVIVASPSERQSGEFLMKARGFARTMGLRTRGDGSNALSLVLPNGSRLVGLPGLEGTTRGFSNPALLLIDEASRVSDSLFDSLTPMLATGNRANRGAGDGVSADLEGISGRGACAEGGQDLPAGVPVRVRAER